MRLYCIIVEQQEQRMHVSMLFSGKRANFPTQTRAAWAAMSFSSMHPCVNVCSLSLSLFSTCKHKGWTSRKSAPGFIIGQKRLHHQFFLSLFSIDCVHGTARQKKNKKNKNKWKPCCSWISIYRIYTVYKRLEQFWKLYKLRRRRHI